jgi:hypothetical protein
LWSHLPNPEFGSFKIGGLKKMTSTEALGLLFVVAFKPSPVNDLIVLGIEDLCFKQNYRGSWREISKLLRFYKKPEFLLYLYLERHSTRSLFGNLLQEGLNKAGQLKFYYPSKMKPPKFPKRKRGYNDKGNARDNFDWRKIQTVSGANPVKEDQRGRIPRTRKEQITRFLYGG